MAKINNLPQYAEQCQYIVARNVDGELWFWGAWDDRNEANQVANTLGNGVVFEREEISSC